jgi:hypothetical protein
MEPRNKLIAIIIFALAFGLVSALIVDLAHGAEAVPVVIKKADLPLNLKGGKAKSATGDSIPGCFSGRAKLDSSAQIVKDWAATHERHACATAPKVYVCLAGKNLSVRCE